MSTAQRRTFSAKSLAIFGLLFASGSLLMLLVSACGDSPATPTVIIPTTAPATTTTASTTVEVVTLPPVTTSGSIAITPSSTTAASDTAPAGSATTTGMIKGVDGQNYYVIAPIRPFYDANAWLGLPLGGMREAKPDGYNWDGLYQNFQRGRVEAHRGGDGKYALMLGLVNQELLDLKKR